MEIATCQELKDELTLELEDIDDHERSAPERLRLAKVALEFAIGVMEDVADETRDSHARAYLINHLKTLASADHGFLTRDFNIDQWIEKFETSDEPEEV